MLQREAMLEFYFKTKKGQNKYKNKNNGIRKYNTKYVTFKSLTEPPFWQLQESS